MRRYASGAVSAVFAVTLSLFVPTHSASGQEGTLTAAMPVEPPVLDPHFSRNYSTRDFAYLIYDTLFAMDSSGAIQPQMVESYEISDDDLTWTFTLRDGLEFHDGQAVTSEDVVASIERWASRDGLGSHLAEATEAWEVVDEKTFRLSLSEPFGLVLDALGKPSSLVPAIMPARLAQSEEATTEIIGSGPFVFVQDAWVPGERLVFEKNPNYVPRSEPADFLAGGKTVNVARVEWRVISDGATSISALQAGEVDWVEAPPLDLLPLIQESPEIVIDAGSGIDMWAGLLRLNHESGPFSDPEIRRVLWKAIDQSEIAPAFGATGDLSLDACHTFFICGSTLANDAGIEAAANPSAESAREALANTSYDNEPVILMQPSNVYVLRGAADVIASQLEQAGFNVDLQTMDWSSLVSRRAEKEGWSAFPAYQQGYDASSPLTHFYIGTNCGDTPGWACDERVTPLLEQFASAADLDTRKAVASQIQEHLYESVPLVVWGQYSQPRAYRNELSDVISSSIPIFWNLSK